MAPAHHAAPPARRWGRRVERLRGFGARKIGGSEAEVWYASDYVSLAEIAHVRPNQRVLTVTYQR